MFRDLARTLFDDNVLFRITEELAKFHVCYGYLRFLKISMSLIGWRNLQSIKRLNFEQLVLISDFSRLISTPLFMQSQAPNFNKPGFDVGQRAS